MKNFKAHFVHVGNMNNKGTQALFKSDVQTLHEVVRGQVTANVSTTDLDGVRKLNLPLKSILPSAVDIPYEKTDQMGKKFGFDRNGIKYKVFAVGMLFFMFLQTLFSISSVIATKAGLRALYRPEVFESIKESDLVISHSDESFKETASLLPLNIFWIITWWSMLWSRTFIVLVAKSFHKDVVLFPNSVGPFRTKVGEYLSKLSLLNCYRLLIRDPVSFDIVKSMGIKNPAVLTYDTAILFEAKMHAVNLDISRPVLGVSPGIYSHSLSKKGVENYVDGHAKALDYAISKYGFSVFFLPHYVSGFSNDDLEMCHLIRSRMKKKDSAKIIETESVDEFKLLLNQMDIVISSKMHPAILAASAFVPVLCVAYDHKQTAFFERLDMNQVILDISLVTDKSLISKIDYVFANKERLKMILSEKIPLWQKDVRESIKQAVEPIANK
jgi:polysaccharide pyruvyl transferase WcaK-like protein